MAYAVLQAVTTRLQREGRLNSQTPAAFLAPGGDGLRSLRSQQVQRPPLAELRAVA
jgi:hypothetical protein